MIFAHSLVRPELQYGIVVIIVAALENVTVRSVRLDSSSASALA